MLAIMVIVDDQGKLQVQGCPAPIALAVLHQAIGALSGAIAQAALEEDKKSREGAGDQGKKGDQLNKSNGVKGDQQIPAPAPPLGGA